MNDCVQEAGVDYDDIELIILTGGSTEIPYIKKEICRLFSKAIISEEGKFSSVSQGLVYRAGVLYGEVE